MFRFFLLILALSSCSKFIEKIDSDSKIKINEKGTDHFSLIFSNNISGETHPCGCRQFPLGGLPQVFGILGNEAKKAPIIYVDTGDSLFPLEITPPYMKESLPFTATHIAEAFQKLRLRYFVPGETDFASGIDFLNTLQDKHQFQILIANSKKTSPLKTKAWDTIEFAGNIYAFIGVVDPILYPQLISKHFENPYDAIAKSIDEVNKKFKNKNIKFILLSHSGLDKDKTYAEKFKDLHWIIGSHTQSFLRQTHDVNNAKIVQVLSKNHYLGKIEFYTDFKKEIYSLLEVRDETQNLVENNPMIPWLIDYKNKLSTVQEEEQKELYKTSEHKTERRKTFNQCISCHEEQGDFWQKTPHALAYATLLNTKAHFNRDCISCHSVGFNKEDGFITPKDIVLFKEEDEKKSKAYWDEIESSFSMIKSVRNLLKKERDKKAKLWKKIDERYEVTHNFANVQCLHCHNQTNEHPFEFDKPESTKDFKSTCLSCHTRDQAPQWYTKDAKGLPGDLDHEIFKIKLKEISCPKFKMK